MRWKRGRVPLTAAELTKRFARVKTTLIGPYVNRNLPVKVRCQRCCYEWETCASSLFRGSGCPRCAQLSAAEITTRFAQAGVTLLDEYRRDVRVRVQCVTCARIWRTTISSVMMGKGCARCYHDSQRLSDEAFAARLRQVKVTALEDYRGQRQRVRVRCQGCGHVWRPLAISLMQGHGCAKCGGQRRKVTDAEIALRCQRVGVTQIGCYYGALSRLKVRCLTCNREWSPIAGSIFSGRSCPRCNGSKTEDEVRKIVERSTGWRFPPARPVWLKGRSSHPLELDGYNPRHQVAFEYQGQHHYQPLYGQEKLLMVKRNDDRKRKLCRRHGVLLICIPYWKQDVASFVRRKLQGAVHG